MAEYRICLFGHDGESAASCFIDAESDDEARTIGRELLTDSTYTQIQVWRQDRLILYTTKSSPGDFSHSPPG
jgi:hypothetical protein